MSACFNDSLLVSLDLTIPMRAYDNVDGLVNIDDPTTRVDNRHCTNSTFRKHVDNVENSRVQCGSRKRVEPVPIRPLMLGIYICSNPSILDTAREVLGDISALPSASSTQRELTFVAMNLRTRYWVSTLMTTSACVCESLSIRGKRRAWVRMR